MTEFGFGDPDAAMDMLKAMGRARELYGDPPDPAFAASVINHAAESGLHAMFVRILDSASQYEPDPDHRMIWILEVTTGRGVLALRRPADQSWREFLGSDPLAVDLGLLPPDAPR